MSPSRMQVRTGRKVGSCRTLLRTSSVEAWPRASCEECVRTIVLEVLYLCVLFAFRLALCPVMPVHLYATPSVHASMGHL